MFIKENRNLYIYIQVFLRCFMSWDGGVFFFNGRICFIKENSTKKTYKNMNEDKVKC